MNMPIEAKGIELKTCFYARKIVLVQNLSEICMRSKMVICLKTFVSVAGNSEV